MLGVGLVSDTPSLPTEHAVEHANHLKIIRVAAEGPNLLEQHLGLKLAVRPLQIGVNARKHNVVAVHHHDQVPGGMAEYARTCRPTDEAQRLQVGRGKPFPEGRGIPRTVQTTDEPTTNSRTPLFKRGSSMYIYRSAHAWRWAFLASRIITFHPPTFPFRPVAT